VLRQAWEDLKEYEGVWCNIDDCCADWLVVGLRKLEEGLKMLGCIE